MSSLSKAISLIVKPRRNSVKGFTLLILFMVSFTFITQAFAQDENPWTKTGLNQDRLMNKLIKPSVCQDKKSWLACLYATGVMLSDSEAFTSTTYVVDKSQITSDHKVLAECKSTSLVRFKEQSPTESPFDSERHNKLRDQSLIKLNQLYGNETVALQSFVSYFTGHSSKASPEANDELVCYHNILAERLKTEPAKLEKLLESIWTWAHFAYDGHSSFSPHPSLLNNDDSDDTIYSVIGVGIHIFEHEKRYFIQKVLKHGVAFGQLKEGDEIIAVDGKSFIEFSNTGQLINNVLGKEGTPVEITVRRFENNAAKNVAVKLVRRKIEFKRIDFDWNKEQSLLTIRLGDFSGFEICDKMSAELESKNPDKVILDLRSNPGGYVVMANCINGLFLGNDLPVLQTADADKVDENKAAKPSVAFTSESKSYTYKGSLVVLIDSSSASASEIVSGTLKDYGRAIIIGERTFGKGSAQDTISVAHIFPKVQLRKTTAYWVLPSGYSIHALGVTPDINILLTPFSIDERNGGSYEETVSWMGSRAFEKPILKSVTPAVDTSISESRFADCRAIKPQQFASMDEMIKSVKGDYQYSHALRVVNCLKRANFYWRAPASNRTQIFTQVYAGKVTVEKFDPIMEVIRNDLKKASGQ